jgi:hypothetical protein
VNVRAAAAFGPTRITVTAAVAARIDALVALDTLQPGEYLFHADDRRRSPLEPYTWTRLVQSTFKAHSGVWAGTLCPRPRSAQPQGALKQCGETPSVAATGYAAVAPVAALGCSIVWGGGVMVSW